MQVSTDYVFGGTSTVPYAESAPLRPANAYGRTKAEGERRALAAHPHGTHIVRTAWLYGRTGENFPRTMLRLAGERDVLTVVDDQHGQPTSAKDVAGQIRQIADSAHRHGIWHATNAGEATWFTFARELYAVAGLDPNRIVPRTSATLRRSAARPAYAVLGHDAWDAHGLAPPRDWRLALRDAVQMGTFDDVLPDRRG